MPAQDIPISDPKSAASAVGACPGCGASAAVELEEFKKLRRVTSDCRAWPAGGRLAVCGRCGLVFKPFDAAFRREAEEIYASYAIYHQSGGREQRVRHPHTGILVPRSTVLAEMLLTPDILPASRALPEPGTLPERGSLLDIGCGNGAFLKAFAAARPGWELRGTEHDRRHAAELEKIAGFKELLPGDFPDFKSQTFNLISLVHVLEHSQDPVAWLSRLRTHLASDGVLFVECPDAELNPFDLLTADHALHFSRQTLAALAARAGLAVTFPEKAWIAKELSAVCRIAQGGRPEKAATFAGRSDSGSGSAGPEEVLRQTRQNLGWLQKLLAQAGSLGAREPIGCFGTSIAGTWLAGELKEKVGFFVDEDPDRAGGDYLGKPVRKPEGVPAESTVLLALAPSVAQSVAARLAPQFPKVRFVTPEPVPAV